MAPGGTPLLPPPPSPLRTSHASRSVRDVGVQLPSLSTQRLAPFAHSNGAAQIELCESGELRVRFVQDRLTMVVSGDGGRIRVLEDGGGGGGGAAAAAAVPQEQHFLRQDLPLPLAEKYAYAARVVQLLRASTPKVTLHLTVEAAAAAAAEDADPPPGPSGAAGAVQQQQQQQQQQHVMRCVMSESEPLPSFELHCAGSGAVLRYSLAGSACDYFPPGHADGHSPLRLSLELGADEGAADGMPYVLEAPSLESGFANCSGLLSVAQKAFRRCLELQAQAQLRASDAQPPFPIAVHERWHAHSRDGAAERCRGGDLDSVNGPDLAACLGVGPSSDDDDDDDGGEAQLDAELSSIASTHSYEAGARSPSLHASFSELYLTQSRASDLGEGEGESADEDEGEGECEGAGAGAGIVGGVECLDGGGFVAHFTDGAQLTLDDTATSVTYSFEGEEETTCPLAVASALHPKLRHKLAQLSLHMLHDDAATEHAAQPLR
jgi:hypothetical protein